MALTERTLYPADGVLRGWESGETAVVWSEDAKAWGATSESNFRSKLGQGQGHGLGLGQGLGQGQHPGTIMENLENHGINPGRSQQNHQTFRKHRKA